jgi:hypothetical protein
MSLPFAGVDALNLPRAASLIQSFPAIRATAANKSQAFCENQGVTGPRMVAGQRYVA